mgnify:CR=1 FL=1
MKRPNSILWFLLILSLPFFLIFTSVRILFNPFFLNFEYNQPGFPVDTYGFTTADRIKWGNYSLEYLFNSADPSFLQIKMDNGQVLYNDRELSHMVDVKNLVQVMQKIWIGVGVLYILFALYAWRSHDFSGFWKGVMRGGWLTNALIVILVVFIFIGFNDLFTNFHHLFFQGDSWLFAYSDTLIRLFPLQLWQDAFLYAGILTAVLSILCIFGGRAFARRFE